MPTLPSSSSSAAPRIGLYLRVSTEMQAQSGISLAEQESRLLAGAARRWPEGEVVAIYRDDGYSGHGLDRPDVKRCLQDVEAGLLDKLLTLDIDRAHRNEYNRRWFESHLAEHHVDMVYELEPTFDRLSMKNLSRGMRGVIAEYYSDWASETTRDKMLHMARNRRRTGGPVPFGLAVNEEKCYIEDPEWFPTLREIFERRARGNSVRAIAKWLTDTGVPPPGLLAWQRQPNDSHGNPRPCPSNAWTRYTVERILRNVAYHGELLYNQSYGKRHNFAPKDKREVVHIPDAWTAFIEDGLWYRVQQVDALNSAPDEGSASYSTFALARLLRCARCGHSMHGYTSSKVRQSKSGPHTHRYRTYRCTGRSNSRVCDAPMIRAPRLEQLVIETICQHIANDAPTRELIRVEAHELLADYSAALNACLTETRQTVSDDTAQRAAYTQALALGLGRLSDESITQLDQQVSALSKRIRESESRLAFAADELALLAQLPARLDALLRESNTAAERLQTAEMPTANHLLVSLVSKIEVDPDTRECRIHLKRALYLDAFNDLHLAPALVVESAQAGMDGSRTHQGRLRSTPQRF